MPSNGQKIFRIQAFPSMQKVLANAKTFNDGHIILKKNHWIQNKKYNSM